MATISDRDRQTESLAKGPEQLMVRNGITAAAGGGQTNAVQLLAEVNEVDTVATDGDSVMLPLIRFPGQMLIVINKAAKNLQVYGNGSDTINGVAAATGVTQMPSSVVVYVAGAAGTWFTTGTGVGFSGSYETMSYKDGLTAHAGGTQAGAQGDANAQLSAMMNRVTTVATIADSVVLPAAVAGLSIMVANAAANSMNVFPNTGDQINALAANAAFAQAGGKAATFYCVKAGFWHAILSA